MGLYLLLVLILHLKCITTFVSYYNIVNFVLNDLKYNSYICNGIYFYSVPEDFFPRKKLNEACGPCDCPPRMTEGDCEDGLECIFNEVIPDLPGTCMKPGNSTIYHY